MAEVKTHGDRANPEPVPGTGERASQRGTEDQLSGPTSDDQALAWEREEQDRLPPRGHASGEVGSEEEGALDESEGFRRRAEENLQRGGSRGPSNEGR